MGLDIVSQDGKEELWSGGYFRFMWFRQTLAKICARGSFDPYLAGDKYGPAVKELFDRLQKSPKWKPKSLDIVSGFAAFFPHSDCDGNWTAEECSGVIELITFCKDTLKVETQTKSHIYKTIFAPQFSKGNSDRTQKVFEEDMDSLLEGLRYCITNKQQAIFS